MKRGSSPTQLDSPSQQSKREKEEEQPLIVLYEYFYSEHVMISIVKIGDTWWSHAGQEINDIEGKYIWEMNEEHTLSQIGKGIYSQEGYARDFFLVHYHQSRQNILGEIEAHWGKRVVDRLLDALRPTLRIPEPLMWKQDVSELRRFHGTNRGTTLATLARASNFLWSLNKKYAFDPRISERWGIWVPDSVFVLYITDWIYCRGVIEVCRYIIKGGNRYNALCQYLSETRGMDIYIQEIIMGKEMERILFALWSLCYIKGIPKGVFKMHILPDLIWTEEMYVDYLPLR